MDSPAVTVAGPVFETETSARVVTESVSLALSLPGLGLSVEVSTEAVFVWPPSVEDGTVYCAVTVASPPAGIVPSEQSKSAGPLVSQVPCEVVTEPRAKPAGHVSESETVRASD